MWEIVVHPPPLSPGIRPRRVQLMVRIEVVILDRLQMTKYFQPNLRGLLIVYKRFLWLEHNWRGISANIKLV